MITLELEKPIFKSEVIVHNIYDLDITSDIIGSIEIYFYTESGAKTLYIDNVYLCEQYRGKRYLRQIIDKLKQEYTQNDITPDFVCLPLPQHINKFKKLGFVFYQDIDGEAHYILNNNIRNNK